MGHTRDELLDLVGKIRTEGAARDPRAAREALQEVRAAVGDDLYDVLQVARGAAGAGDVRADAFRWVASYLMGLRLGLAGTAAGQHLEDAWTAVRAAARALDDVGMVDGYGFADEMN